MFPLRRRFSRSQTNAPRANELFIARTSLDLAHHFGRPGQMIDHRGMLNSRLDSLERPLFHDGGVKRPPARILAVRD